MLMGVLFGVEFVADASFNIIENVTVGLISVTALHDFPESFLV